MTGYKPTLERITPEEAMNLFAYASTEEIHRAKALYDVYRESKGVRNAPLWDMLDLWDLMSLLSFVYDTGRVQGIRQERAKHVIADQKKEVAA